MTKQYENGKSVKKLADEIGTTPEVVRHLAGVPKSTRTLREDQVTDVKSHIPPM